MNAIDEVTARIEMRLRGSIGRPHNGAYIVNKYKYYGVPIESLVIVAIMAAQSVFLRSRRSGKPFKLTLTSSSIGISVISRLGITETTYGEIFSVGDFILESLYQLKYIDIGREYDGYRAPYIITLESKWDTLGDIPDELVKNTLIGTSFRRFAKITSLRNPMTKRPYIKRMSSEEDFGHLLDTPFVKALDNLQRTPWKINKVILKTLRNNINKFINVDSDKAKDKSKVIEMKFILAKASALVDKVFYQAVECDYRGRVYYTESFLNFQGSDIARGLFQFGDMKLMDPKGYRWLCIHTACSYNQSYTLEELGGIEWLETDYSEHLINEGLETISVDKMTLEDRERWTIESIGWILGLAENKEFRMEAEKPVQFLSCCLEVEGYLNNPQYLSSLPIPIDGSNNGWQHLAAMSKDKQAGELVSLVPQDIQKDFYVQVAKRLIERMPEWFKDKQIPMKDIRKGITKRGSMTRAYSAGQRKISENMYYDCHAEGYTEKYGITKEDCDILSKNLILAINDTCVGPLKTMKFLQKLTDYILNSGYKSLDWTTPSGFPVLYEVWRQHNMVIRSTIRGFGQIGHSIKVPTIIPEVGRIPCRRSFASGCSPNFVHSMDAAHMALVINSFGGNFGAIHDSFSTHASDIDRLLEHTKWQFAIMYNTDNFFCKIEHMLLETREGYNIKQPEIGDLNISDIIKSDYFFC